MRRYFIALLALVSATASSAQQTIRVGDQLQKLLLAETAIKSLYVDEVNDTVLVESGIAAMLKELDPHSTYMTSDEVRKSEETLQGNFEGIGVQFNMVKDTLFIVQTIPGGPSEKVGIIAGDRIVSANDTAIAGVGMSNEDIMSRLRGPKGTHVSLGIVRKGVSGVISFDVIRDVIPLNTVDASFMAAPGIGYIKISSFGTNTVNEFVTAWEKLLKQGAESLVLDLQGNGGGYLGAAVGIGNEFLERDRMIVYTQGRTSPKMTYLAEGNGHFRKGRLVVLIDEYTASASEIVSGAIQDWDRGVIIGRRSFGKGLVQRPIDFPDGSMIRLTVAKYFTPSGRCIQKPYGEDIDYRDDIVERLHSGQLVSADSIHFADSLKCSTLVKGRTVYGGGGIMPDIFVPIDTTRSTVWYREATAHGAVLQASLSYVDRNRKELQRRFRNFRKYQTEFSVGQDLLDMVLANAAEADIGFDQEGYDTALPYITVQLKALVARDLWGMSEYFAVLNALDPIYLRALEYLQSDEPIL
ncbi:MAG: S41 family peptidase [Bacteroidaceae bacterium]|nr:S41 family peptidase [Bacteroidaceae bacterium]